MNTTKRKTMQNQKAVEAAVLKCAAFPLSKSAKIFEWPLPCATFTDLNSFVENCIEPLQNSIELQAKGYDIFADLHRVLRVFRIPGALAIQEADGIQITLNGTPLASFLKAGTHGDGRCIVVDVASVRAAVQPTGFAKVACAVVVVVVAAFAIRRREQCISCYWPRGSGSYGSL